MTAWVGLRRFLQAVRTFVVNPAALTAGTIALVVALFAIGPALLQAIELNWLDLRFRTRGALTPTPSVVLAVIDEESIAAEGRWPWPRSRIAELVDALSDDGARTIGFDVTFAEAEENSRLALVDQFARTVDTLQIKNPKLIEFLRESRANADSDLALAQALKRSSSPVVLGYFFHMTQASAGGWLDRNEVERRNSGIEGSKYPQVLFKDDPAAVRFLEAYAPQSNLDAFTAVAASSGYFSVVSDPDGTVRSLPLVIQSGEELYPPLAVLCAWHFLGKPNLAVRAGRHGVEGVQLGERFIPTDEAGRMLLNYRGPPQTFPHYSVSDILAGRLPRGTFKDKVVLVGVTALGVYDIRSTPFSPVFPGPEIHATAIDNILTGDFIARPRWAGIFDLAAIVVLGTLVGVALPRTSAVGGLAFSATLFGGYVVAALLLFAGAGIWLNMVYPLTAVAATYTVLTLYRYLTEERERKRIKDTFKHYVSPDIIEVVMKDPQGLRLGGQERVMTALFSDLEGFTSFSEHHSPTELIGILSDYYAEMTEQVFAQQGTLVEYVGDELFAIFGAPVVQADHATRACAAALAMRSRRRALGEDWAKIGRPRLFARTGINSGPMLVGNIGSKYRFHYSALGDHVNLSSRLEGLNKIYDTEIIIGEHTAELVAGQFLLRQLDLVRVKGRQTALRIYELLGTADAQLPSEQAEMLKLYAAAQEAYRQQRWGDALELLNQCLMRWPDDGPSKLMHERCRIYRDSPPAEDWDGVFAHQTKG